MKAKKVKKTKLGKKKKPGMKTMVGTAICKIKGMYTTLKSILEIICVIGVIAIIGFFVIFFIVNEIETRKTKRFYQALNGVKVDLSSIGCSDEEIVSRVFDHPLKHRIQVPYCSRKRLIGLSGGEESKIAAEIIRQLQAINPFYNKKKDINRVRCLVEQVAGVLPEKRHVNIYLVDIASVNAFCLIDGTLLVTRGLLRTFRDDNQLAFVIGHELGHATARHGSEMMTKQLALTALGEKVVVPVLSKAIPKHKESWDLLIRNGYDLGVVLGGLFPYSRRMEYEADVLGVIYMTKAGFAPSGAASAMGMIRDRSADEPFWVTWLSTHPAPKKRCERIEQLLCNIDRLMQDESMDEEQDEADNTDETMRMLAEVTFAKIEVPNAQGEVLFVPGLLSHNDALKFYGEPLLNAYPGCTISVLQWKTGSEPTWNDSKFKSEALANYVARLLQEKTDGERSRLILIGHSMGCRICVNTAHVLEQGNQKVRQVVLLGAAVNYDDEKLQSCVNASEADPVSLFNPHDYILKYLYHNVEGTAAAGLHGTRKFIPGLLEYRLANTDPGGGDVMKPDFVNNLSCHLASAYIEQLKAVNNGELPVNVKIDHSSITFSQPAPVLPQRFAIPKIASMNVIDDYHDWVFASFCTPAFNLPITLPRRSAQSPTNDDRTEANDSFENNKEPNRPVVNPDPNGRTTHVPPKTIYILFNPYGQCCGWSLQQEPVRKRFAEAKAQIDEQLKEKFSLEQ